MPPGLRFARPEDMVHGTGERDGLVTSLKQLAQLSADVFRRYLRVEALDHLTILVHQELGEIPADIFRTVIVRLLRLEPFIQIGGVRPVHLDLGEQGEVHIVLGGGEFEDLVIGARFLGAELIARKAENGDAVTFRLEGTQTCVLRREASLAGEVDDQHRLVAEIRKADIVAANAGHCKIVNVHENHLY